MGSLLIMGVIGLIGLIFVAAIDGSIEGLLFNKIQNKFMRFIVRTSISSALLTVIIYFVMNKYSSGIELSKALIYGFIAVLFMHFAVLTGGEVK